MKTIYSWHKQPCKARVFSGCKEIHTSSNDLLFYRLIRHAWTLDVNSDVFAVDPTHQILSMVLYACMRRKTHDGSVTEAILWWQQSRIHALVSTKRFARGHRTQQNIELAQSHSHQDHDKLILNGTALYNSGASRAGSRQFETWSKNPN